MLNIQDINCRFDGYLFCYNYANPLHQRANFTCNEPTRHVRQTLRQGPLFKWLYLHSKHNIQTQSWKVNSTDGEMLSCHDDVIKWKHFPRYWPFVPGIHRSPLNSSYKGQWRGALMISFICAWINGWVNNRKAGDLRRHRAHYDVSVMV